MVQILNFLEKTYVEKAMMRGFSLLWDNKQMQTAPCMFIINMCKWQV